ncbi:FMN-binding domain protein [Enterococcus faecalis]|nr:FMN-binding domain protein [Enterococcus faecalis]
MKTKKIVVGLFCSMIILMGCQPDQRTEKMKESTEAEAVQVTSGASAATNALL